MSQAAIEQIKELNHAYHLITGENAYLYTTTPMPNATPRFVFNTSNNTITNAGDALAHMTEILEKVRSGWTHSEVMYGKERTNP